MGIDWASIHEKKGFTPLTPALAFFSLIYGLGVRFRSMTLKKEQGRDLPGAVISVGNLTVGGTGKTPATITVAEWALGRGYRPAVLSRGYGGRFGGDVLEVSDGRSLKATPHEAGDEPCLMAGKLPGVPVIIARKRYDAGMHAHRKFGTDLFVLDDGFQHHPLKREIDLVLVDAVHPFGNGHLLPWGPLREPMSALKRAHALIMTRTENGKEEERTEEELKAMCPGKPIFKSDHSPDLVVFPESKKRREPDFLKGKRVIAFAGIARPGAFRETLTRLGAEVVLFKAFQDHHVFQPGEVRELDRLQKDTRADFILTTEKDWARAGDVLGRIPELAFLTIHFRLLPDPDRFFGFLKSSIEI